MNLGIQFLLKILYSNVSQFIQYANKDNLNDFDLEVLKFKCEIIKNKIETIEKRITECQNIRK
jgi:hypothetical protein